MWTEDVPDMAGNWSFVTPKMYGVCPYVRRPFLFTIFLDVKLYYLRSIPLVQFDFLVEEILAFHRNVIRFV